MSRFDDLQARMAEITRQLGSDGAGKATQAIQDALGAAGLTGSPGNSKAASAGASSAMAQPAFVSELLSRLGVTYKDPGTPASAADQMDAPETDTQGRFVAGTYGNAAGSRRYKVYIPASYQGQAMPLMVMLHGCTQDADDFARGTQMNLLAEEQGFLVVYPTQDSAANTSKCWNWFKAIDQTRGQGEPSLIAGITNEVIDQYGLDRDAVFVAGLSAGGAMAVIMGSTYPDLYRAVGVHSGLPYAAASDLSSALSAMRGAARRPDAGRRNPNAALQAIPVIVFHGDRDTTVSPANGSRVIDDFVADFQHSGEENGVSDVVTTVIEEGKADSGHGFSRTSLHADGRPVLAEHWLIHGAGHAWAGGSAKGSWTDAKGPDASREMLRFFSTQRAAGK
ncbi:extracellular catalytic domain type 1 short-chain-length polyhydroxyalkanoate depolymerase [Herbaspirillum autotrophicum]|uniref:extracellular catalytic domain type 1 short-chain-length polyhydroxyalkanoate depolymerase n=1 Tax=Herbaspirillum autotrophicum TaxID=180195 RepID=UPI00067A94C8|nr:PHB depolymerase family esterase [Herbaspirillum autotrophicum]